MTQMQSSGAHKSVWYAPNSTQHSSTLLRPRCSRATDEQSHATLHARNTSPIPTRKDQIVNEPISLQVSVLLWIRL
uniref:Uncharacterized protein n=1 Tax=Arundo donax TaxID=35708 RepID=A0A0A9HB24_ARUDO